MLKCDETRNQKNMDVTRLVCKTRRKVDFKKIILDMVASQKDHSADFTKIWSALYQLSIMNLFS